MNKEEFINFIAKEKLIKKVEAEKIVNIFTSSIISAMSKKNRNQSVSLIGFGSFSVSYVEGRTGKNPKDGSPITIEAYHQPRFKAGQKLKDSVNGRK